MSLLTFLPEIADKQRMPLSCSISISGSTPHRRATEMARQVASDWAGHPALPRLAKTSQRPDLSLLTVTKSVPQPILNFVVVPLVVRVLSLSSGLFISCCGVLWAVVITWLLRQISIYSYAFAAKFESKTVSLVDIFNCRIRWQINCLRDSIVSVFLKSCLDSNMPFQRYIMCRHKNFSVFFRNVGYFERRHSPGKQVKDFID